MMPEILLVEADHDMRNPKLAKGVFRVPGISRVQGITRPEGTLIAGDGGDVTTLPMTSRRRSRRSHGVGARRSRFRMRARSSLSSIIEVKKRGDSDEDVKHKFGVIKRDVTAATSKSRGLSVADIVVVAPSSIPITTSGKVRRAACVEQYRHGQFARLDP
jgi:acyl-CoA synthetase (AMP-forming)/AMP-acid ligase II